MELPHGIVLNAEEKSMREKILAHVWTSNVKDEFGLANLMQTQAEFTHAMKVMDRIGGWIERGRFEGGSQIGGRLTASETGAVIYNGQNHMDGCRSETQNSIKEAVNLVCARTQHNHDCFLSVPWYCRREKFWQLNYDIDVPCLVQWRSLWYSAPTSLNNDLLNGGVIFEKYNNVISMAIKTPLTFSLDNG